VARLAVGDVTRSARPYRGLLPITPRLGPLSIDDPAVRTVAAHLAAIVAAAVVLLLQGPAPLTESQALLAVLIAIGFSALRIMVVRKRLMPSTMALDAIGTVVFLAGTGAPASPFYFLALAGVWWAAHIPRRRSGLIYGLAFATAYGLLIVPQALYERQLVGAFEDAAVLLIVAVLCDWFVSVDRRALALNEALTVPPFGAEQLAIREGLLRALRTMDIPVDVILTAGQVGLTAVQAELLCYLVMGLTNVEISDAAAISEATVRYRLTRLYRALGVRGRREAAGRAQAMGLSKGSRSSSGIGEAP